jgi:hypothetical protein
VGGFADFVDAGHCAWVMGGCSYAFIMQVALCAACVCNGHQILLALHFVPVIKKSNFDRRQAIISLLPTAYYLFRELYDASSSFAYNYYCLAS